MRTDNNMVTLSGMIAAPFTFQNAYKGENFYMTEILVRRKSGYIDMIQVVVSDRLTDTAKDRTGHSVSICGQFRSYNECRDKETHLRLFVFAKEWSLLEKECGYLPKNQIDLYGSLCQVPVYRKTSLGREITDILLAVNRAYGKSDYIHCICWGKNARLAADLSVGNCICLSGRIQSRYYKKVYGERTERKRAFEVLASEITVSDRRGKGYGDA